MSIFNFTDLQDYRGIMIIILIIGAILLFSKNLEAVLLMTGIIVNVIAICLNTGVVDYKKENKLPTTYLPPRRFDLIKKSRFKDAPDYTQVKDGYSSLLPNLNKADYEKRIPKYDNSEYKGAVDFEKNEIYTENSMDRLTQSNINRYKIQKRDSNVNNRRVIQPIMNTELGEEEMKPWWAHYDT